jgi:di/tricarboxylate transporter
MNLWHPLNRLPRSWRVPALLVLFALTLAVGCLTQQPLNAFPMSALELAPNTDAARIIINCWQVVDSNLHFATTVQHYDNYFIPCYSTTLALACVFIADWLFSPDAWANFHGKLLAWLMWVAGILDYIENYGINKMLAGKIEDRWVHMSYYSALIKFALIAAGLTYFFTGLFVGFVRRKRT